MLAEDDLLEDLQDPMQRFPGDEMSYLTVDLDYWMLHSTERSSILFFRKLVALNKPIVVVKDHQRLLHDVNVKWPRDDTLINVDFHSDISSEVYLLLNKRLACSNWIDFVHQRRRGHYVWIYPSYETCFKEKHGFCDDQRLPFVGNRTNPWRKLSHRCGLGAIDLKRVERIGVAISPTYCELDAVHTVVTRLLQVPVEKKCKTHVFAKLSRKYSQPAVLPRAVCGAFSSGRGDRAKRHAA